MRKIVFAAAVATSALGLAACGETADAVGDVAESVEADVEANAEAVAEGAEGAMEEVAEGAEGAMEEGMEKAEGAMEELSLIHI